MPPTSPLASDNTPIHAAAPNISAADAALEEDEFTEFAELRSKCRLFRKCLGRFPAL